MPRIRTRTSNQVPAPSARLTGSQSPASPSPHGGHLSTTRRRPGRPPKTRPAAPAAHAAHAAITTASTQSIHHHHHHHHPSDHPPPSTNHSNPSPHQLQHPQSQQPPQPHRSPNPPPPPLPPHWAGPPTTTPATTNNVATTTPAADNITNTNMNMGSIANLPPSGLVAPEISYHVPHQHLQSQQYQHHPQPHHHHHQTPTGRYSPLVRPHGPPSQSPSLPQTQSPVPIAHRPPPPIVTPVPPPKPTTLPPPRADRNIDKVALGDLLFRTWYPSYYGKELLGDLSGPSKGDDGGAKSHPGNTSNNNKKDKDKEPQQPVLERLYVCPTCFKYSKEIVNWCFHVKSCPRRGTVPGRKIYVHPRGRRKVLIPQATKGPGAKRRRTDSSVQYIEEIIQDEGEWSIWEVDGETEGLFCQNLSLFAKLFLDNKSVFFDVTGFNYYLLAYTPPPPKAGTEPAKEPEVSWPQVIGFFSKEKMSWDNNNLACILVFPPWQRKGLGALLMGASYEISRREGVLGGPEKPISDLGKKGYKRFWAGEIARWLLGLEVHDGQEETIVDVHDCSQATWICMEDCLAVLRDMGVVEEAGMGPGKPKATAVADGIVETREAQHNHANLPDAGQGDATAAEDGSTTVKDVPRVRIDKAAVRRYVGDQRISLERACDPDGFVEGYAMKSASASSKGDDDNNEMDES